MQMKYILRVWSCIGLLVCAASALGAQPNLGAVASGRISDMNKWYGRAGGLTGSDRVEILRSGGRPNVISALAGTVMVSYSEEVAKWTNMPLAKSQPAAAEHPFRAPRKPHY
jgi:hypothetical protein